MFFFHYCNNNDNSNNKHKASLLRGISDMEHTSFYLHTHKKTNKQDSKQKVFNLQPLWTSRNLTQHLQVSVASFYLTPPHTITSSISELNHSVHFIAEVCLALNSWNLKLPFHKHLTQQQTLADTLSITNVLRLVGSSILFTPPPDHRKHYY